MSLDAPHIREIKISLDGLASSEPLLTREQLAGRLQVSKRQCELMEKSGLPTVRFGRSGCLVRHDWAAVKAWLNTETERHLTNQFQKE